MSDVKSNSERRREAKVPAGEAHCHGEEMSWIDYVMSSWSCECCRGWNLSNLSISWTLVSGILQSSIGNETDSGMISFSVSQAIHDHVDFLTPELSAELLSSHMHLNGFIDGPFIQMSAERSDPEGCVPALLCKQEQSGSSKDDLELSRKMKTFSINYKHTFKALLTWTQHASTWRVLTVSFLTQICSYNCV